MSQITIPQTTPPQSKWMQRAHVALVSTVWISSLLFGLYILAFFIGAAFQGDLTVWNEAALPDLYEEGEPAATAGIGLHFAMGAIILILGSIQLLQGVRVRYPKVHRWLGRIYVAASLLAAIGGFTFILVSGTVGGTVMNIGFGLYGILMFICAIETTRHARAKRFEQHRAWSWRLYALAVGSWLYRMEYGFWFLFFGTIGLTRDFRGPFDIVMAFFFYIPNLILVELLLRARRRESTRTTRTVALTATVVATALVVLGTYAFTTMLWGPVILAVFGFG